MALIKCPECGGTVSDKATKCPHCGYNFQTEPTVEQPEPEQNEPEKVEPENNKSGLRTTTLIIAVSVVILLIVGLILLFGNRNRDNDYYYPQDTIAAESYTSTADTTGCVADASSDSETSSYSEPAANANEYTFQFVVSGMTYKLTFNKSEKTAQLNVNGETFYGTCNYDGFFREGQIEVRGFEGASDYNIIRKDSRATWGYGVWIDYKNNYLYITQDAAKAYNPDYRIELTRIN